MTEMRSSHTFGAPVGVSAHDLMVVVGARELDLASAPHVSALVDDAADARTCRAVSLDLSAVTFMDCAGLRALLRARERFDYVTLVGAQPGVLRVLDLTKTRGAFRVIPAVPAASP